MADRASGASAHYPVRRFDMIRVMRNLVASAALLAMLACSTGAQQNAGSALGPSEVAARVGDRAITAGELDARWRDDRPSEHAQATQAIYDGRRAALDALVADMLIADAAKAKGQTAEQYRTAEIIASKVRVHEPRVSARGGMSALRERARRLGARERDRRRLRPPGRAGWLHRGGRARGDVVGHKRLPR